MTLVYKRNIALAIVLSLITCGVYSLYWYYLLIKNIRALRHDDSGCVREMLCLIFVPFYSLYWWFTRGNFVKKEFAAHHCKASATGIIYLILAILELGIISRAIMQKDFNSLPAEAKTRPVWHMSSKKKKILIIAISAWLIAGILILPYLIFTFKKSYVFDLLTKEMESEAVKYCQTVFGDSEGGDFIIYNITASDDTGTAEDIIKYNFGQRDNFVYPYTDTCVYLKNKSIKVAVYFEKDENGENQIVRCERIDQGRTAKP